MKAPTVVQIGCLGGCWQVLKLGTWLRIKLMRSTQIRKSLQKPLGCHQIVPSSDPSSLAGSTHSDVSPWSLHQKKHYSNPNCQETWWSKCLNFVLQTTNHSKVDNHTWIMHSQRDVYSYCRPKYFYNPNTPAATCFCNCNSDTEFVVQQLVLSGHVPWRQHGRRRRHEHENATLWLTETNMDWKMFIAKRHVITTLKRNWTWTRWCRLSIPVVARQWEELMV